MHKAAKAYLTTKVTTTNQGDILIMLYDAAIKNLKQAKVRIEEKNYAAKGILISKAMDIIAELSESLNSEKGGSLAENLHNIYFYCSTKLLTANLKMDTELLDEVIKILEGIRSAFAEIIPGQAQQPGFSPAGHAPSQTPPMPGMMPPSAGQPPKAAPQATPLRPVPPVSAPVSGPVSGPAAPKSQPAAPEAQPPAKSAVPEKKPAPVTPLHPGPNVPKGPVRRAVAAYGNAR